MAADRVKWLAFVAAAVSFLLCMLLFGLPILSALCS